MAMPVLNPHAAVALPLVAEDVVHPARVVLDEFGPRLRGRQRPNVLGAWNGGPEKGSG
jgi:hypothetical protein